jgi:hypothetical protein
MAPKDAKPLQAASLRVLDQVLQFGEGESICLYGEKEKEERKKKVLQTFKQKERPLPLCLKMHSIPEETTNLKLCECL